MPTHVETAEFARKIAEAAGYRFTDEAPPSRVVLLCRDEKTEKSRVMSFE
jgi:wyosine [tRNA(Phe)-imidazoG37] synthetase (radical SAM superfamily)